MGGGIRVSVQRILEAYKKQKCLWNPKHPGYKNKEVRQNAYSKMLLDLDIPKLTQNDIKLKIKSIRTGYRKELGLYLKRKAEGQCNVPKLVWFNLAHSFLKNVSVSRPRDHLNTNDDTIKFEMNISQDEELIQIPSEECIYKDDTEDQLHLDDVNEYRKRTTNDDNKQFLLSTEDDTIELEEYKLEDHQQANVVKRNQKNKNVTLKPSNLHQCCKVLEHEDEYQIFCNSIAAQLREIPDLYSRSVAKFKIQHILFEAETGHYKKNSNCTASIPIYPNSNIT